MTAAAPTRRGHATATVGLAIFLGTLAMLFAALFLAYGVMRAQAPAWPPPGLPPLPRGALAGNTLVLVAASLALRAAAGAARLDAGPRVRRGVRLALALGTAFLAAQALVWRSLVLAGGGPASGIYGSVFFAISGLHALHVLGGLVALAFVAFSARAPGADARRLGLVALYWDFVLVVWLLFFFAACLR